MFALTLMKAWLPLLTGHTNLTRQHQWQGNSCRMRRGHHSAWINPGPIGPSCNLALIELGVQLACRKPQCVPVWQQCNEHGKGRQKYFCT